MSDQAPDRLDRIEALLDRVAQQQAVTAQQQQVAADRMAAHDDRMAALDNRIAAQAARMAAHDDRMAALDEEFQAARSLFQQDLHSLDERLDRLEAVVAADHSQAAIDRAEFRSTVDRLLQAIADRFTSNGGNP